MIDLVLSSSGAPVRLFLTNFAVFSGIPARLPLDGPRSPVVLVYGDLSPAALSEFAQQYLAILAIPSVEVDAHSQSSPRYYGDGPNRGVILSPLQTVTAGFAPFARTATGEVLVGEGAVGETSTFQFAADIIAEVQRALSGFYEEGVGTDALGRHAPVPEAVYGAPSVSFHFNLIESVIRCAYERIGLPLLTLARWPGSAPAALFVSHDIDVVRKWTAKRVGYELAYSFLELARFRPSRLSLTLSSLKDRLLAGRDPYWNFDNILSLQEANGCRSTWFFAPFGGKYDRRTAPIGPVYRRTRSEILDVINRIRAADCEIGLHGTRQAFIDGMEMGQQRSTLEDLGVEIRGTRHHFLMFRHGKTLESVVDAGLQYDATLGYSDRVAFRNGAAAPFFPPVRNEFEVELVEIPLHFMDGVFLHTDDVPAAQYRVHAACSAARAAGGLFSVLVHPGCMDEAEIPGFAAFYQAFLNRCRQEGFRAMTGAELCDWWVGRERVLRHMQTTERGWQIAGAPVLDEMEFILRSPKPLEVEMEGCAGTVTESHDCSIVRPENVNPERGFCLVRKG